MTAGHADAVEVQRHGASPAAFHWRGRVYRVRGVLAHWLETGPWWQSASVRGLLATDAPNRPAGAAGAAGEREFWQVEAVVGRQSLPGVYELCCDWSRGDPGEWSVTTLDAEGGGS